MSETLRLVTLIFVFLPAAVTGQPRVGVGPPKGSEPGRLSAPIVYEDLMLVFSSDQGVAAIVFTEKLERGVLYKFRYESKDGKSKEARTGKLFEKYKQLPGKKAGEVEVVNDGGEMWFKVGPFEVEWSRATEGSGWIYYSPEKVRVNIAHAEEFDKLDLKRFGK